MRIEFLIDEPSHLWAVAEAQQTAFGYLNPAVTLDQRVERVRTAMQKDRMPTTLIALDPDGTLLGGASLQASTLTHPQLTPWLSAVFVLPAYRNRGIASALSLRAVREAACLGHDTLYLFTPKNETLYARLGWIFHDRAHYQEIPLVIMARPTDR